MGFDSVLVANRGEVALRVITAARALGLATVAVYSDADRRAPHVVAADEAVRLGPAPAGESYLSVRAVMAAVERSGAGALHPGYGFLAERAELARSCEEAGVVFVGPPSGVIEAMGRKDEARRRASELGVPVSPGRGGAEGDESELLALGLPLLIKPVAGGGGKAMRTVRRPEELAAALAAARREALATSGEETLLVERLVEGARHVEVQVLADTHGHLVHLFDRDCSIQRRRQKVIEEAPADWVEAAVRERLYGYATALARGIGYVNAGTVEFLVRGEEVYFLEMNTRLQVEHRVTELVCGVDLVALQFLVAAGAPLPFSQEDLRCAGHAVEARVYAEDPEAGFLPQAGRAEYVVWPTGVIVDEALRSGGEVSPHYDPMVAKLVASGPTREAARRRLVAAIDETFVLGPRMNLAQLRAVLSSPEFASGDYDTGWLERLAPASGEADPEPALVAAAWASVHAGHRGNDPLALGDGWRVAGPPEASVVGLVAPDGYHELTLVPGSGEVSTPLATHAVALVSESEPLLELELDGECHRFLVRRDGEHWLVGHRGSVFAFAAPRDLAPAPAATTGGLVRAPVPGVISTVAVAVGDAVDTGEVIATMESMKMELVLRAPHEGVVESLGVAPGEHVALEQLVAVIAPGDR